jgi:hypothetical protein
MNRKALSLTILTFLGAAGALTGEAFADETATIRNESMHAVPMVLKWSNVPFESAPIVLAPGQSYTSRGPDGQSLFVRFNATPTNSQFPRWVSYQVITRFTASSFDPGVVSVYRNTSAFEVNLVLP